MALRFETMKPVNATNKMLSSTNFAGVESLDMGGGPYISAAGLEVLVSTKIAELDLSACVGVDDDAVKIVAKLPRLRSLALDNCNAISDAAIGALLIAEDLEVLTVRWCYDLTDVSCGYLTKMKLRTLSLVGCEGITDAGVSSLAQNTTITNLELPESGEITDEGLRQLSSGPIPLKRLWMEHLECITDAAIEAIGRIETLEELSFRWLSGVTSQALISLKL